MRKRQMVVQGSAERSVVPSQVSSLLPKALFHFLGPLLKRYLMVFVLLLGWNLCLCGYVLQATGWAYAEERNCLVQRVAGREERTRAAGAMQNNVFVGGGLCMANLCRYSFACESRFRSLCASWTYSRECLFVTSGHWEVDSWRGYCGATGFATRSTLGTSACSWWVRVPRVQHRGGVGRPSPGATGSTHRGLQAVVLAPRLAHLCSMLTQGNHITWDGFLSLFLPSNPFTMGLFRERTGHLEATLPEFQSITRKIFTHDHRSELKVSRPFPS